ncbi:MAG: GntR family transcriptional regulator [Cyanobacteria bacterium]|nr:GntR family transcriptional regulator [Cyanobacteriota bacterium]
MVVSDRDLQNKLAPESVLKQGGALMNPGFSAIEENLTADKSMSESFDYNDLENISKAALARIEINQLPKEIPDFQAPGATKDSLIAEWLKDWIVSSLQTGKLNENNLLPRKGDIAQYLGVSIGTVQNAIRFVEDEGWVESKQRIGTLIRNVDASGSRMRKQTSKRDQAVVAIRQLIVDKGYQPSESLPSAREIAKMIGSAPNTTRLALEFLASQGTLESRGTRGNKANWGLLEIPSCEFESAICAIESETLIDQLERDLKKLIADRFEINDKLPSHLELAELLKVSIKTVHDAMKRLSDQGIVRSKRGRYGTYIVRKPDTSRFFSPTENNIFLPAQDASFYNYEKVERHLKLLIQQNYQIGDKLPSMGALSEQLDVSSNTIRKALQNLSKENVVTFARGRYGGTFVTDLPKNIEDTKSFTWVSINPETIKTYRRMPKATP